MVVTDPEDPLPHDEVFHPVLSPTGYNRPSLRRRPVRPCPTPMCRRDRQPVLPVTTRGPNRVVCSQLVIPLAACGAVPDGSIRLAAVLHSLVLWHSRLHRSSETDSTNRGDEAPVFGPGNPLFFDPSYPKRQASESAFDLQISIWVGDQRIPGVVCSFLETKSLIPTFWRSACLAGLSGACSGPAAQESLSVFFSVFVPAEAASGGWQCT